MGKITLEPVGITSNGAFLLNVYVDDELVASRLELRVGQVYNIGNLSEPARPKSG